jgi:NTP pyrophosphatase (non-canonical NTP hydrolase)
MDDKTTLKELREAVQEFVDTRNWNQFHTPKNLAMSIAIEAAEIMEHFQWDNPAEAPQSIADQEIHAAVADELADVMIYCLGFANATDIDISAAVKAKLARSETRFPVEQVYGKLGYRSPD